MRAAKHTYKKAGMKQPTAPKPKATVKQYDEAFDSLAAFLFEQYRKSKEEV